MTSQRGGSSLSGGSGFSTESDFEIADLIQRIVRGLAPTLGLGILGLSIAAIGYVVISPYRPVSSSIRVNFAFDGFERGEYPDKSKFQADDLRSPDLITEVLKKLRVEDAASVQSEVRGGLSVEGMISPEVVKLRDRLRSTGQTPPNFIPDEYLVTLTLPRKAPLSVVQREQFLRELLIAFQERFQRTYALVPQEIGNVQDALKTADFPDYVFILEADIKNVLNYLDIQGGGTSQQTGAGEEKSKKFRQFRSRTTNLSFADLRKRIELFKQLQIDQVLGVIRMNGLTRNRSVALTKLEYALLNLKEDERLALEREGVAKDYLAKTEARSQNYVMGIKSQASQQRVDTPLLDQGLIDSLLANDSYNYTLRDAVKASLEVKRIQSELSKVQQRKIELTGSAEGSGSGANRQEEFQSAQAALQELLANYDQLIDSVRKTQLDYSHQMYADAVRQSAEVKTLDGGIARALIVPSAIGGFLGLAIGMGLSLIGIYSGNLKRG